jgi:hypothetical protein
MRVSTYDLLRAFLLGVIDGSVKTGAARTRGCSWLFPLRRQTFLQKNYRDLEYFQLNYCKRVSSFLGEFLAGRKNFFFGERELKKSRLQ